MADEINWNIHKNSWLIKIYKKLWFEIQKDEEWNYIKDCWWENNRNSDLVMIRKKGK